MTNSRTIKMLFLAFVIFSALYSQSTQSATTFTPDITSVLKDSMKFDLSGENQSIAFWLPYEVFEGLVRSTNKNAAQKEMDELTPLKSFNVFMVRRSYKGEDGMTRVLSNTDLANSTRLRDNSGHDYTALKELPKSISQLVLNFKRGVESNSQGIEYSVLVFTNINESGKPIVSASSRDKMTLRFQQITPLKQVDFNWRTPFDSLRPQLPCAKCGELLLPSWKYCPFDGTTVEFKPSPINP